MSETLSPLGNRVLVRVAKAEEKIGSIVIPDAVVTTVRRGEVLAVGPGEAVMYPDGSHRLDCGVPSGAVVLFGKDAGVPVGEGLLILRGTDLLAVVRCGNDE